MRVTLLGHAAVLVELAGATCLMDPVFFDPFEEGAVVSCPRRRTHPERLPPIDLLVVSHRHPDHFDIPSLARVPRDCEAICPADPLIVYALRRLGFERIHPVHPMGEIRGADFELFPTASQVTGVREFGMVFHDASGTCWNQVDSILSPATIAAVLGRYGRVALLFAMYASQNFDFFDSLSARFPHETHRANLETVLPIGPGLAVPGSASTPPRPPRTWTTPPCGDASGTPGPGALGGCACSRSSPTGPPIPPPCAPSATRSAGRTTSTSSSPHGRGCPWWPPGATTEHFTAARRP